MPGMTSEQLNAAAADYLPGHLGMRVTEVSDQGLSGEITVGPHLLAPNGFLHAGSIITLADSLCGFGSIVNLPDGASGFTTIELKSNFLGTARSGIVQAEARPVHLGRTTQLWDATVTHADTGKTIALFRCTQMVLWPK